MQITQALVQTGTPTSRDVSPETQASQKTGDAFAQVFSDVEQADQKLGLAGSMSVETDATLEDAPLKIAQDGGEEATDMPHDSSVTKIQGEIDHAVVDGKESEVVGKVTLATSDQTEIRASNRSPPANKQTGAPVAAAGVAVQIPPDTSIPISPEIEARTRDSKAEPTQNTQFRETVILPEEVPVTALEPRQPGNVGQQFFDGRDGQVAKAMLPVTERPQGGQGGVAIPETTKLVMPSEGDETMKPQRTSFGTPILDAETSRTPVAPALGIVPTDLRSEGVTHPPTGHPTRANAAEAPMPTLKAAAVGIDPPLRDGLVMPGKLDTNVRMPIGPQEIVPLQNSDSDSRDAKTNGRFSEFVNTLAGSRGAPPQFKDTLDSSNTTVIGANVSKGDPSPPVQKDIGFDASKQVSAQYVLAPTDDVPTSDQISRQAVVAQPGQIDNSPGVISVRQLMSHGASPPSNDVQQVVALAKQGSVHERTAAPSSEEPHRNRQRDGAEIVVQRATVPPPLPSAGWSQTMARIEVQNMYSFATKPQSVQLDNVEGMGAEISGRDGLEARPATGHGMAISPQVSPPAGADARLAQIVAQQLALHAKPLPDGPVEITLRPEELGRVRMLLSAIDGTIHVLLNAERPETLDLMRRNIDFLIQDFRDLGYRDVAFEFGQHQQGGASRDQPSADGTPPIGLEDDAPQLANKKLVELTQGGVDIRL